MPPTSQPGVEKSLGASACFKSPGFSPIPCTRFPKILWLRKNRPDIFAVDQMLPFADRIPAAENAAPAVCGLFAGVPLPGV